MLRWALGLAAGAGFAMLAGAALAGMWIDHHASARCYDQVNDVPARPVAIVLGARVYPSGAPSAILEDRLATALELYRARKVDRILVSGDHRAAEYDEPNAMRRWLLARGVREADVFMDHAGLRTLDTMERAAKVFQVERAIVCTQAFHLPRSVFLARRAGIDAVGARADRRTYLYRHKDRAREAVAKTVAVLDSYVLGRGAQHLGPPIPITGDARATHDASSQL